MNIFIRTGLAPYRIDTYNALHKKMNMKMCFYNRECSDQKHDIELLESLCTFRPLYLKGITFKSENRKWCFGLWKLLRKEKPNVVIVPEFQISSLQVLLYRWLTRSKFKVVSMTDDSYDMITNGNDFTKLHARLRRFFPKYLDNLIVVTPSVEQWYQEHYGKGIWMPIIMDEEKAVSYYERLLPQSMMLAEKYGLIGKKVLLSVSRLVELKNLHNVIDAFSQAQTEATLVIVGDGPERESLETHAKQINKDIIFTGRFDGDDLYAWYNIASVLILASYQEAFGAVTNEALIAGCRVVVSDKCGSSCLVNDSNGELVDPMNIKSISAAIDKQMQLSKNTNLQSSRTSLMFVSFKERITNLEKHLSLC